MLHTVCVCLCVMYVVCACVCVCVCVSALGLGERGSILDESHSPLPLTELGGPPSLGGFEPAALCTGCFTRSALIVKLSFGKQPNFTVLQS